MRFIVSFYFLLIWLMIFDTGFFLSFFVINCDLSLFSSFFDTKKLVSCTSDWDLIIFALGFAGVSLAPLTSVRADFVNPFSFDWAKACRIVFSVELSTFLATPYKKKKSAELRV